MLPLGLDIFSFLARANLLPLRLMAVFTAPRSFRYANSLLSSRQLVSQPDPGLVTSSQVLASSHGSHPSFLYLVLLVFEAVLEVICVSLPGYIAARQGMFDSDAQKLVANLNVTLFTPCLGMCVLRRSTVFRG